MTPADWTPERVARFWGYWSTQPRTQAEYFSRQVGPGLVGFLRMTGRLRGRVLDYGCGPGYLLEQLLAEPLEVWGCDFSHEAAALVNRKFAGRSNWRGAAPLASLPAPYPDAHFDVATCVETVEHLSDELLTPTLAELRRVIRPGGIVLITTPNAEDLDSRMVYCPFCDSEFHGMQHVRAFSAGSLRGVLEAQGFEVVFCQGLDLKRFQRPRLSSLRGWHPRELGPSLLGLLARSMDRLAPRPFPASRELSRMLGPGGHLCAVVTRPPAASQA